MQKGYDFGLWEGKKVDLSADDMVILFASVLKALYLKKVDGVTPDTIELLLKVVSIGFNTWFEHEELARSVIELNKKEIAEIVIEEEKEKASDKKLTKADRIAKLLDELMNELKK